MGLREPLEHGAVTLRRAADSTTLPARFQLVAAMEPCPYGDCDQTQEIRRCTAEQMARYHARVAMQARNAGSSPPRVTGYSPAGPFR